MDNKKMMRDGTQERSFIEANSDLVTAEILLNGLLYFNDFQPRKDRSLADNVELGMANGQFKTNVFDSFVNGNKNKVLPEQVVNNEMLANLNVVELNVDGTLPEVKAYFDTDKEKPSIAMGGPTCLVLEDPVAKQVHFVFRGTNDAEWMDNAEVLNGKNSLLQQDAMAYFEDVMKKRGYTDQGYEVYLSGHSKGGNNAMYVAAEAMNKHDKKYNIASVISYDGPGFSPEYLSQLTDEQKQKLNDVGCVICADGDIVSPLGFQICDNLNILATNQKDFSGAENVEVSEATKKMSLLTLTAHSIDALVHVDNGKLVLNDTVPERKGYCKELQQVCQKGLTEGTKEEKELFTRGFMTVLQNLRDPVKYVKEETHTLSKEDTHKGLDMLKGMADKLECKEVNSFLRQIRLVDIVTRKLRGLDNQEKKNAEKEFDSAVEERKRLTAPVDKAYVPVAEMDKAKAQDDKNLSLEELISKHEDEIASKGSDDKEVDNSDREDR